MKPFMSARGWGGLSCLFLVVRSTPRLGSSIWIRSISCLDDLLSQEAVHHRVLHVVGKYPECQASIEDEADKHEHCKS